MNAIKALRILHAIKGADMGILLKSKTFWTGIGLVGFGVVQIVQGENETGVRSILEGLGLVFLRNAIK